MLESQPQTVDFAAYRSQLKNQDIIADVEKQVNAYQVKKVDVSKQLKAIEAFEAQAVQSAEQTKGKVDAELADLEKTLKNIETARPFEDLTVVCIGWSERRMVTSRDSNWLTWVCTNRTRLSLPAPTSMSASRSSWPRVAGRCPATRYGSLYPWRVQRHVLTTSAGEIR